MTMTELYRVEERGRRVRVMRAPAGRVALGVGRFFTALPVAGAGLFAYFMIDALGPVPFDTERVVMYVASALGLGAIFAVAWGVAGGMRHEEWDFDFGASTIRYETRLSMGSPQGVEVDSSNLRAVRVVRRSIGRKSRVEVVFDEAVEVVADTRLGGDKLDDVIEAMKNLAENESIPFENG
jgi:hypothetical protein